MATINSADEAAAWACRNLPAKNTLTAADAKIVEERFQTRLSTISDGQVPDGTTPAGTPDGLAPDRPAISQWGSARFGQNGPPAR